MLTDAAVRKLALVFPEAEESAHHGHPDFRVHGKIFATLRPGEQCAVVKLPPDEVPALVRSDPKAFALNAWSKQGWMNINLGHVTPAQLRELLEIAWRGVAPKKLVAAYDSTER